MYRRAQLKQEVKQIIAGTRPRPMWVALLYLVIASIGASIIQSIISTVAGTSFLSNQWMDLMMNYGDNIEAAIEEFFMMYAQQLVSLIGTIMASSFLTSILLTLWNGLMSLGFSGYCLSLVKGEKPSVGKIFCGFPLIGKVLLTNFLLWVFTILWTALYAIIAMVIAVVGVLFMESVPAVSVIAFVVAYIFYIVFIVRLYLRYAMVNYVMLDTGKYGLEAITDSKRMMKGKKGKLFGLYLSFIGWYLLEAVIVLVGVLAVSLLFVLGGGGAIAGASFGVAAGLIGGGMFVMVVMTAVMYLINIWLKPYINGSAAKFYLHFKPQGPVQESLPGADTAESEY